MKIAVSKLLENGGNKSKAMLEAGFSPAYAKNSHKMTASKSYQEFLKQNYLSDKYLALKHFRLTNSTSQGREEFKSIKKGKKWVKYTDEQIKLAIEGPEEDPTGAKIMYIKEGFRERIAVFRTPNDIVQMKAIDSAYKIRGDYDPKEPLKIEHTMSEEDKEVFNKIFNNNKK